MTNHVAHPSWPETQRDELPPPRPAITATLSVDTLWRLREIADEERRDLSRYIGLIDQELERRVLEAHPGFSYEDGGGRELTGDQLVISMTYDRRYNEPSDEVVQTVLNSEALTPAESNDLIKFKAVINGRTWLKLMRRGGAIAAMIAPLRPLRSASPKFEPRERK